MCCAPDFPKIHPKKPKGIRAYPRAEAASLKRANQRKENGKLRPKPTSSWLGATHLYAGPSADARGFKGLWLKKRQSIAPTYAASWQDALCPAQKSLSPLPRTPYFLNTLYVRCSIFMPQAKVRAQIYRFTSSGSTAQLCASLWFSQGANPRFNLWRAEGSATWLVFGRATKRFDKARQKDLGTRDSFNLAGRTDLPLPD